MMKMNARKVLFILIVSMILMTSCRWDIWGTSPVDYGKGTGTVGGNVRFTGESPKNIKATRAVYNDRVVVSWDPVKGADYYDIFRTEYREGQVPSEPVRLIESPIECIYEDLDVEPGVMYNYTVSARSFVHRDIIGKQETASLGWILAPPSAFTASQGKAVKTITLSWNPVQNVDGYKCYWSESGYEGTWKVVTPKGQETRDYVIPANSRQFDFEIPEQFRGKSLYFRMESVSKSGIKSQPGSIALGYTFVEGAPKAPENLAASLAESSKSITVSWDAMMDKKNNVEYDWEIYRKTASEPETRIYSTVNGDLPPQKKGEETYFIVDSDSSLVPGTVYTYVVRAIGELKDKNGLPYQVNGLSSEASGYLYSPPVKLEKEPAVITGDRNGFIFSFRNALGADIYKNEFSYRVYGKSSLSDPEWKVIDEYRDIRVDDSADAFYEVFIPYDGNDNNLEYFTVRTFNGVEESPGYDEINGAICVPRPGEPENYNLSDNMYTEGLSDNGGIYDLFISFSADMDVASYNVRLRDALGNETVKNGLVPQKVDTTGYLLNIGSTGIGEKASASIQGVDRLGRTGEWSRYDEGYSAITSDTLIKYMQIYALKPWEYIGSTYLTDGYPYGKDINGKWKSSAIYGKISQAGTGSLTDGITEKSYYNNGTIKYVATVQGIGGRVSFTYNRFGEVPYMATTGNFTMVVNASGTGSCTGGIEVLGMYPATIGFGNISVSNQAFVGTYTVNQNNGTKVSEISPDQR